MHHSIYASTDGRYTINFKLGSILVYINVQYNKSHSSAHKQ